MVRKANDQTNRRTVLYATAAGLGTVTAAGTATASPSEGEITVDPEEEYGVEPIDSFEIKRIIEASSYSVVVTETDDRVSAVKISAEDNGAVEHGVISEKRNRDSQETVDISSETVREEGFDGIVESSSTVIEKQEEISRQIGSCDLDYCNEDGWPHYQEGVTLTLTEPADVIGKATLTEIIGGLVAIKKGVLLGGAVGVLVAAMLGLGTGRNWTISEYDRDGWLFPRISAGVANSWDADPSSHQTVIQSRGRHVYECHEGHP
ncbi:hypothetical protein [Natronobeatus ordinarius]|uniref:hypothetical protein n=1 Tax=Natronobeatus ordinarius TaxID=2963433 RepID=UPI0020CCB89F|nr:hypothetical protein [Natronobeatus ordinarius]